MRNNKVMTLVGILLSTMVIASACGSANTDADLSENTFIIYLNGK